MGFFKQVIEHWKHDWKTNKELFWLEFIGMVCNVIPSAILSLMVSHAPFLFIYSMYWVGSVCFTRTNWIRKSSYGTLVCGFFVLVNTVAIINVLFFN